ncbi:hypothetical protein UCD39_15265 [Nitrospirillum sp. BR 11752]|uniref:hypothetical protein n=1 Tax=Nitrospirillum sp. BR 11752 TaxID=3104293 RepID=UPI002EBAAFB8|nr:hypothetical protein [Nitrospirillum sp. BR 11752]
MEEGALGDRRAWMRAFAAATLLGVVVGLVGPFGSFYNDSLAILVGYWVVALWLGTGLLGVALRCAFLRSRTWPPARAAALVALATVLAAVPLAVLCRLLAQALWPGPISRIGWPLWYGQTLLMSLCCAVGYGVLGGICAGRRRGGRHPRERRWRSSRSRPRSPAVSWTGFRPPWAGTSSPCRWRIITCGPTRPKAPPWC